MIKSKTYQGLEGQNFIQSSELAFTTVYKVKREGIQHDLYISGDTNRKYTYTSSEGKISFPVAFNTGGEKIFVIYKETSTVVTPPVSVCVPVSIVTDSLPAGIVGVPYSAAIELAGTLFFEASDQSIPSWMSLDVFENMVFLNGIPDTETTETVEFDISNQCGTESFSASFPVVPPAPTLSVHNNSTAGVFVTAIGNLPYTLQSGSIPIGFGSSVSGVHTAFTGGIGIGITGFSFPFSLKLYKNAVLLETLSVTGNGGYIFGDQTFLSSDIIEIILQ